MSTKPLYTTFDSVKVRLINKVQFEVEGEELISGQLPFVLFSQLICDAETDVEQDLRSRYAIPFRSITTGTYAGLPDHTQRAIRKVVDKRAVHLVLSTDFGRGSHINAEGYSKEAKEDYDLEIDRLLGRDREGENSKHDRFRFAPPLEGLMLAPTNSLADDGYKGTIINTDASEHGAASYAEHQINNPAQSYVTRRVNNGTGG